MDTYQVSGHDLFKKQHKSSNFHQKGQYFMVFTQYRVFLHILGQNSTQKHILGQNSTQKHIYGHDLSK